MYSVSILSRECGLGVYVGGRMKVGEEIGDGVCTRGSMGFSGLRFVKIVIIVIYVQVIVISR